MKITKTVQPTSEPITLTEAKLHLRVDHADEDALITSLIVAAREWFESVTWQTFPTTTYKYVLDEFPDCNSIELPRGPAQSVTSVVYYDENGDNTTFNSSNYIVSTVSNPATITLKSNIDWPSIDLQAVDGVEITYVAGHTTIPTLLKQGMLLLVGHYYENREGASDKIIREIPLAVDNIANLLSVH